MSDLERCTPVLTPVAVSGEQMAAGIDAAQTVGVFITNR